MVGGTLQVRFNGPQETATKRYAREDVTISEVTISCGEPVFAVIPQPTVMTGEPNRHLAPNMECTTAFVHHWLVSKSTVAGSAAGDCCSIKVPLVQKSTGS